MHRSDLGADGDRSRDAAASGTASGLTRSVPHDRNLAPLRFPRERRLPAAWPTVASPVARFLARASLGNRSYPPRDERRAPAYLDGGAGHGSARPAPGALLAGP